MLGEVYSEDEVTGYGQAYIDPDRLAFSPNGDGVNDVVIPWLGLLRNAAEVRMEVLDAKGNSDRNTWICLSPSEGHGGILRVCICCRYTYGERRS